MAKPDLTLINWAGERIPQLQVDVDLERDWMEDGACFGAPEEIRNLFFEFGRGDEFRAACEICSTCPVKSLCYAYAVIYGERGTWGGTNQTERDERRPFIVGEVVELWPRLYEKWLGRKEQARAEVAEAQDLGVPAPSPDVDLSDPHVRARARAAEGIHLASWALGRRNPRKAAEQREAD